MIFAALHVGDDAFDEFAQRLDVLLRVGVRTVQLLHHVVLLNQNNWEVVVLPSVVFGQPPAPRAADWGVETDNRVQELAAVSVLRTLAVLVLFKDIPP